MIFKTGGGFLGTLTIIFVIAKLLGYINWSWWIVFLPVLIPFIITLTVLIISLIVVVIAGVIGGLIDLK